MGNDPLLERAQRGDAEALDELFRREWRPIFGLAYTALRDRNDAQDVTQEAFLRALRQLDRFEHRGVPFHAYVATIARNLIRDRWRQTVPASISIHDVDLIGLETTDMTVITRDEQTYLRRVLATLPIDYQTVIRLRILEERPTDEVAELMGRSPGAIRVLQHRAVVALRDQFEKESRT
ncbi:MAG: sigma-70 family RNA polymerase sigma factor [Nitrolancea sp.]